MIRSTDKDFTHGKHIDIMVGDCVESMKSLPDKSVQTCITSPPYWGLRDYGHEKQLGMEKTPEEFVANMVEVFREVRRVLRDDGTLWLNLGDSYASGKARYSTKEQTLAGGKRNDAKLGALQDGKRACVKHHDYLKDKDLIGIPWLVAFALQRDGWWLRQDIIWAKPNCMPESVKDRCTKSHEYVFLLTKSPQYYYDIDAIKEPVKQDWGTRNRTNGKYHNEGTGLQPHTGLEKSYTTKNKRSVWWVSPKPFNGAHFAVFPPELIEPCVLAGCPKDGVVLDPFGGSGTTGAVALKHGRKAILCELNEEYAKIIPKRIESITGLSATQKTFDDWW